MNQTKLKLLFPLGILLSCSVSAQTSAVRFRNEGKICIGTGSADPGRDGLYVPDGFQAVQESSIQQDGNFVLGGDFINDVRTGEVFLPSDGRFVFRGKQLQRIGGTADKAKHYIRFPRMLEIDNPAGVSLDSRMGMQAGVLEFTRGTLVLTSRALDRRMAETAHLLAESLKGERKEAGVRVELELLLPEETGRAAFIGFSPPFSGLKSSVFLHNYLTAPDPAGFFGQSGQTITSQSFPLDPGRSYFAGGSVFEDEKPVRRLDRLVLGEGGERVLTGDVRVQLKPGFNYLGNPFTCPLDLSDFLEGSEDVYPAVWYYTNGVSQAIDPDSRSFSITGTFLVNQKEGALIDKTEAAPLQMFIVWARRATELVLPASRRIHARSQFFRSQRNVDDELLLEIRNPQSGDYDRTCVVFRREADWTATDRYDLPKLFNHTGGICQLASLSEEGREMSVNVIAPEQESLPLCFKPSRIAEDLILEASRIESLRSTGPVWLQDRKTGAMIDLLEHPLYSFRSMPEDPQDRFALHFGSLPTGLSPEAKASVKVVAQGGHLFLSGLQPEDQGSQVSLFSMQGQCLLRFELREVVCGRVLIPFAPERGAYLLCVQGKRHLTRKIIL